MAVPVVRSDRRRLVLGAAALSALALLPKAALATPQAAAELLRKLVKGAPQQGRVTLQASEIAENGNSVPLTVTVESPMTEADYIKAIHVFNEKNPQPDVFSVRLGPRNGRAVVGTRIKLGDSQKIVAIAETSGGQFWSASADVIVTLAACLEEAT